MIIRFSSICALRGKFKNGTPNFLVFLNTHVNIQRGKLILKGRKSSVPYNGRHSIGHTIELGILLQVQKTIMNLLLDGIVLHESLAELIGYLFHVRAGKSILFELPQDRKSTRLNSSHVAISYALLCLK